MPSAHVAGTHRLAAQMPLGQCSPFTHSTHSPAPSHTSPPPSLQGAPIGSLSYPHAPSKHRRAVQSLSSPGHSASITHRTLFPPPPLPPPPPPAPTAPPPAGSGESSQ